ncbi:MAG: hypothetical protein EOO66_06010, partial [Methylobacterium sp.]
FVGSSSPATVVGDVVVAQVIADITAPRKEQTPGSVRGFDVRTGKLLWTFHTIPQKGEFGNDTWEGEAWKYTGNTGVWTMMSADPQLGYIYLPVESPTNDFYGGHRLGNGLFGESIVCLDARTGKRVWHFQIVHHGLWDYDPPAAPILHDVVMGGKRIKAVTQLTKQGFMFVFDRTTGKPVWPIEERPVPQSKIPGEQSSPTQPFPTWPKPLQAQGYSEDQLIDFTPELHAEALKIMEQYEKGPLYTPLVEVKPGLKGTMINPGYGGGANWNGAAVDPATNIMYVPIRYKPNAAGLAKGDPSRTNMAYVQSGNHVINGPRGLPLYEAYAQIWASDDIQYSGGGVAYASAYNLYHNRQAARLATMLGEDPAPYAREAVLIGQAMRAELWLPGEGRFAEYRDWLGERAVHPSAGLWSFYHVVDSGVPTPREAWRMADAVTRDMPLIPVAGPGVPADRPYGVYASSTWMPYSWSVNNVVMGENLHTALALWQAGRGEDAYTLTKAALLASMYMGISPGNVGSLNYLDVYRREAQRDFADGSGVMARTIVEGLFGIAPDAMTQTLTLRPGLPAAWNHAELTHPDVGVAFRREGDRDRWTVRQSAARFARLSLRLVARRDRIAAVTADGRPVRWTLDADAVGAPLIVVDAALGAATQIEVQWSGRPIAAPIAAGARLV